MDNFTFENTTRVHFGRDQIRQLANEIPAGSKVLLTYGGGSIKRNGTYDEALAALKHTQVVEFAGIEPNPRYETLMAAVKLARETSVDQIVALGGGSVIDGSKFIAAAFHFNGDPWTILSEGAAVDAALPLGCVLTLPATGSETNIGSVVTRGEDKLGFLSPLVRPRFAILDPSKTFTLPPRQSGNGVIDAFVHIMEQYLTYPVNAAVQDRFSEGLLLTLIEEGPKVLANPEDYDARANIMWTATQALNGQLGQGVPQDWASHMIGHELTALYGLDHAQTLAIVLPALMDEKRQAKRAKLLQYAARVWQLTDGDEDARIDAAIAKTRAFFEQMQVSTRLSAYQIGDEVLSQVPEQLKRHNLQALGEHRDITPDQVPQILRRSL